MTGRLHVLLLGIHTAFGNIGCEKKKVETSMSPNLILVVTYINPHAVRKHSWQGFRDGSLPTVPKCAAVAAN